MKKILVVEDTKLTREMVKDALTLRGYTIFEAKDGVEGLKLANEKRPDLIILDIVMPRMDGIEACRLIKSEVQTKGIPVIMLTSRTDSSDVKNALEAGAIDYLKKPLDEVELISRVESAFKVKAFTDHIAFFKSKLKDVITTDDLTGLRNASYFWEYLNSELKNFERLQNPLSIMVIDIDDFKRVNDMFGHIQGDSVLKEVADILLSRLKRSDLLCRYGGEEFVVTMVDTGENEAYTIAEDMRKSICDNVFKGKDFTFNLTISLGVATLTADASEESKNAIAIFEKADRALYEAKARGKGKTMVWQPEMKGAGLEL